MSILAIRVEGISKRYRIGARQRPSTFREVLTEGFTRPFRRAPRDPEDTIWALQDVSFEVRPGEAIGIIGRNGSGKTTLLKILSRITEPSSGRAETRGRVASLLEVGTGFHPELSGRENVFLNGAVLGMSRQEIRSHFDSIVAFAEIERFLDTAVKHYSSGMYLRLAFAVAAHLDTDILFVDEVLAVGDAAFQRKCLAKMAEVTGQGRTILFVSHNMGTIVEFCPRALHLDRGRLQADGPSADVVRDYLARGAASGSVELAAAPGLHSGPGPMRIRRIALLDQSGAPGATLEHGAPLRVEVDMTGPVGSSAILAVAVRSALGPIVFELNSADDGFPITLRDGRARVTVYLEANHLNHGEYSVSASLWNRFYQLNDSVEDCLNVSVHTWSEGVSRGRGIVKLEGRWAQEPPA